ncbi:MAG: ComF family protein [Alkalimonas sp.]|nr:ComF family protein [Alkalimonas sp.]
MITKRIIKGLHWLLPNRCLWCTLPAHQPQQQLCTACQNALPEFDMVFYHGNLLWLPAVQRGLPKLQADRLVSLSWYQQPWKLAITQWKFNQDLAAGQWLLSCFAQLAHNYQEAGFPLPDLLTYIPMPRKRQRQRGFNQAELLAKTLAEVWQRPVVALLSRKQLDKQQLNLHRSARLRNLRRAFQVSESEQHLLRQTESIALVDDVITTGSTMRFACKALKQAGASNIQLWTLAITESAAR